MNKQVITGVGVAVLVVLGALFGLPAYQASSWKSSTLERVNKYVEATNNSSRDISLSYKKTTLTTDDYKNLESAFSSELSNTESMLADLKSPGTALGVDVTGDHKEATKNYETLKSTLESLKKIAQEGKARAVAEGEFTELTKDIENAQTLDDFAGLLPNFKKGQKVIEDFSTGSFGTDYDKKSAKAFARFVTELEATVNGNSDGSGLEAIANEIEALSNEEETLNLKKEKAYNDLIDTLNATTKKLE